MFRPIFAVLAPKIAKIARINNTVDGIIIATLVENIYQKKKIEKSPKKASKNGARSAPFCWWGRFGDFSNFLLFLVNIFNECCNNYSVYRSTLALLVVQEDRQDSFLAAAAPHAWYETNLSRHTLGGKNRALLILGAPCLRYFRKDLEKILKTML